MSVSQGVNSVEVAVAILDVIAGFDAPVRASDIARVSGLSKSRLHKYLVSLCRSNMLYQDRRTNLYSLSDKITALASAVERQNGSIETINNALCHLTARTNMSSGLVVRKGDTVSLLYYNRSNRHIDIDYRQNTPVPLAQSAAGKVYLAFADEYKDFNLLDPAELAQIRDSGYAVRLYKAEGMPGAKSVACPVFNHRGRLIAAAVIMGFLPECEKALAQIAGELIAAIRELNLSTRSE